MTKQSVMIATPCINSVFPFYATSLAQTSAALVRAEIGWHIDLDVQASNITDARNAIAARFLASKHTDLAFIDSDMGWRAPDFIRLCSHDVDVVGGIYRQKQKEVSFTAKAKKGAQPDGRGLVEAEWVGAGFLRIRRSCFEKLAAACPKGGLFDQLRGVSEDVSFCKRWNAAGGTVYADTKIKLQHWGMTAYE